MNNTKPDPYAFLMNYNSEDDSEHETTNTEYSISEPIQPQTIETKNCCCSIL